MVNGLVRGMLFCFVSAVAWGSMFPIMSSALKVMDPFYFTAIRYGVASAIFAILLDLTEGPRAFFLDGKAVSLWLFGSAGFAGFGFLVFLGQEMIPGSSGAVVAATIVATMPLMGACMRWITVGQRPPVYTFLAMLFALFGVLVVLTKGHPSELGAIRTSMVADGLIVLGVFCWVVYTWGSSMFGDWSPLRYTTLTSLLGTLTILFVIVAATTTGLLHVPTIAGVVAVKWQMLYMILIASVMAVFTWNAGNRTIGLINGVLFINLVPISALVVTGILGYRVTGVQVFGSVIVILSLVGNNLYQRRGLSRLPEQSEAT